jgi:serine/threonine-protein kinase SRPK3
MLRLHPEKRAKASDLKHHKWLEDIVVQGEIDVIRRMEQDEAIKRKAAEERRASRSRATSRETVAVLDQSERDAMKPVEESVLLVDGEEEGEPAQGVPSPPRHQAPILNAPPIPVVNPSGLARALQSNRQSSGSKGGDARQPSTGKGSTSAGGTSKRRK